MDVHSQEAQKLQNIFQNLLKETVKGDKAPENTDSEFALFYPSEQYNGFFNDELKEILENPLTFKNLQEALLLLNKKGEQIDRILDKLKKRKEKLENIKYMFLNMQHNEQKLHSTKRFGFLSSWLFGNKEERELKDAILDTKKFLKKQHGISSKEDVKKTSVKIKSIKSKLKKISSMLKVNNKRKSIIIESLKELAAKIKGNIVSKHPELQNFIDLLTCVQSHRLSVLKEKYNFVPKNREDFTKAVRECSRDVKRSELRKKFYANKLDLLLSVATELEKGVAHQQFLQKEQGRYRQNNGFERSRWL